MNRKATRRQVETAVTPMLTKGEQLQRSGPAWAVEHRGKAPLLFRERDLHEVVLTDQRLILLTRPRRRRPLGVNNLVLAKRYTTFSLERARRLRPMLQLRVRTSADRVLVLEFRPRDRRVARDLAAAVRASGDVRPRGRPSHPVAREAAAPEPAAPEPAAPEAAAPEPAAPEAVTPGPAASELVRFEPPPPEVPVAPEKPSRKEQRRARKESKRAANEQTGAGEEAPERRNRPERRKRSDGPPGSFERRSGRDRRSDWGDAKTSRKPRRQALNNTKESDRGSEGDDIIDLLAP
ncbi:MAG: hypothetical protein ACT4PI_17535 [Actinomycetota bacterium]